MEQISVGRRIFNSELAAAVGSMGRIANNHKRTNRKVSKES